MIRSALLDGPDPRAGREAVSDHVARLGPLPAAGPGLIAALDRSDLRGRGGAGFPAARKWQAVAANGRGHAVVLANGAEGEPLSLKDRVLMEARPHLVLDGAALAAAAVGAEEVILYVGTEHRRAVDAMTRALAERSPAERAATRVVTAPVRYVSGEETAAVHFVDEGVALPTSLPPRPYERGVGGRATLVQNVETLAHAALIARFGDGWFRSLGEVGASGTALLTLGGAVNRPGVVEVAQGTTIGETVTAAGGLASPASAVLLGGYFGGWVDAREAWTLPLDGPMLQGQHRTLGSGIVAVLPDRRCGVAETARILAYLADQSARQCGPCVFGLRAMADATSRIAGSAGDRGDLERLRRWSGEIAGRGACRHPDGAAGFLSSALGVFAEEFARHADRRPCGATPVAGAA